MSRKRRDAAQRSMGDFVSRGGSKNRVEISDDEDDEVEEINTQESMESNRSSRLSRLRTRRQRREMEQEHLFPDDEPNVEWQQLQQVLMMSKLEAEKQEERRKMCGTVQDVMNLAVQIEPLNSKRSKSLGTETARKNTGKKQEDQREGAESPDLFVTPPEDQEQLSDKEAPNNIESDPEFPNSPPLPVTVRSPDPNSEGVKETNSQQAASAGPSVRQDNLDTRRKLNLRRSKREAADLSSQKENKLEKKANLSESEVRDQVIQSGNSNNGDANPGEKRKLEEDDDDVTDDEDEEPLSALKIKRKISLKRRKPWVSLENSDSDDMQDVDKKCSKRSPDRLHDPSPKRIAVSDTDEKAKRNGKEPSAETRQIRTPTSMIRLSRPYKNTRCRPTNLKEAMKANIYFAPPGFDLPAYTVLIIRMFEKFRRRLCVAQSKVKARIPWGSPVPPGTRDTLDLQLSKKSPASTGTRGSVFLRNSPHRATGSDTKIQSELDISDRRRSLRSSSNPVKQATASTSTSKSPNATIPPYKVDSDSDDGDYLKSYLDEMARPSVSSSTKKPAPSFSRNRGRSNIEIAEDWETGKTEASGEPSVKTQTKSSSDGVTPSMEIDDDGKEETRKPVVGDQGSLDDANVISDRESSEIQSSTVGSSAGTLENNNKVTANSGTDQTKLDNKNSSSEGGVLPESETANNDEGSMDTDQENRSEIIRPPKRRSLLRTAISDDSTDDESDFSRPLISMGFPGKETSAGSEAPDSGDVAGTHDQDPLVSQSLTPQSDSQGMVGKSILDTMTADGEELLPSQTLLDSGMTTNEQTEETLEEGSFDVAGTSSSAAGSSINQAKERLAEEERVVVDIDSTESQRVRRTRSAAAENAAAAAEKRHQMSSRRNLREACPPSSLDDFLSTSEPKDGETETRESTVECPLCYQHFASKEIEAHASDCQGPPTQSEETGARSEPGPSIRSVPSVYRTLTGERGELKNLKVVLERSPVVKQKLLQKATQEAESVKRSLAFEKDSRPSGSLDRCRSSRSSDQDSRKPSRNTRAALRTESESEESGHVREKEESSSAEVYSWLDASSPEKKKPKQTYGSSGRVKSDEVDTTGKASKVQAPGEMFSRRTDEVKSDSDTSDDGLMVQYGAQRVSPRRKDRKEATADETDENEVALALLGGSRKKRPLSMSKGSKAKKSRPRRDSDSEEGDEASIVCELCSKKIPKELYRQHVDEELETRERAKKNVPRKAEENAPKLGGDFIPLNATAESDEVDTTSKASKVQAPGETFSRRTDEVESDSDTSVHPYGAQRVSSRRKDRKQATTDETDENEVALALLGGRSKKRPLSLSKSSKAKKSRPRRDSDSEESDEASIVCELCNKKIPKELYRQHVDEELETRERARKNVPRKAEENAPKLGGDFIPLNATVESDEDDTTGKASKVQAPGETFSRRSDEVECDSDTSDDCLMVQYGAKRVSARREDRKQATADETDENEVALALLGGSSKKRPQSLSKGSKAKKSRPARDLDSEESDKASIVCRLCNKKIPKELYRQHVDEELETRKRAQKNVPRKAEVVTVTDKRQGSRKDEQRRSSTRVQAQRTAPCTSTATEDTENDDVDWDRVSNSPIKCFQFTENSNSVVDFDNQFEHLKETKSGNRRSNYGQNDGSTRGNRGGYRGFGARGGYRGSGNSGNYRGSYKKVYGRGKKYGKYRGSRGRK